MCCKTDGEKEDRGPNGDVGIAGNNGSDGKGKWSEMVRARVKELGIMACFEKSVAVWNEGQEEVRMTKEDVEDASGEGKQVLVWRRRMPWWIERDGEWKFERLLLEWDKSGHPHLWVDMDW